MCLQSSAKGRTRFSRNLLNSFVAIFLLCMSFSAQAKDYYFSSSTGNDSYSSTQAQNQSTPWKTIGKLNSFFSSLSAGDNIYFKRGETFYGTIIVTKSGTSGNPITVSDYGSGALPVITGFTTLVNWTNEGNGIYSKAIASAAQTNMVTIDGIQYGMGRYPDASYLTFESYSGNTSITDASLSSSTNWTGAEVAIRKNDWTIDRCLITRHSGGTLTYTSKGSAQTPYANYGYFIQNDLRTLTNYGEWYHNTSTGKFYMYFGSVNPASKNIQVATLNYLFLNGNYDNITVDNLNFIGSIDNAVYFSNGNDNCIVQNSNVSFSGKNGISFSTGSNNVATSNNVSNCNRMGISSDGTSSQILNNTIASIGTIPGQNIAADGYTGITVLGNGAIVRYNTIHNIGASGINVKYTGAATIQYNFIDTVCTVMDDGAGIYTSTPNNSPRVIDHNIILNVIGNSDGTNNTNPLSAGIFLDETATNVTVSNNTMAHVPYNGIKLHKADNNTITDNTAYDNSYGIYFQNTSSATSVNNRMRRNIFFAKTAAQFPMQFYSIVDNILSLTADSNYYVRPIDDNLTISVQQPSTGWSWVNKSLSGWQNYSFGQDLHAKKSPKAITNVNQLNFQYNASSSAKTISFSGLSYVDAKGNVYNNSATIPAWSSLVLIANGTATDTNKPPVANAGTDQDITLPINYATLTGRGTDPDGTIRSYSWAKISGPALGSISASLSATTAVVNLIQGIYKYELTVTDDDGAVDRDTVQVTVDQTGGSPLLPAVDPINTVNGLNYLYYEGEWNTIPEFTKLTPVKSGFVNNFDLSPANSSTNYGFSFSGFIDVPDDGEYTFYTTSDDGSLLYIDDELVVSNDGLHGENEESGTIGLKAGKHTITGLFFQASGDELFSVKYSSSTIAKQLISSSILYRVNLLPAVNPANTVNGLDYKYYEGTWNNLPDFTSLSPVETGTAKEFDLSLANRSTSYGLSFTGYVSVPTDGQYTFYTNSDDGSNLYIDDILMVSNDGVHPPNEESGTIGLEAGKHAIRVVFFQQYVGSVFTVSYQGSGIDKQEIPLSALYRVNTESRTVSGTNLNLNSRSFTNVTTDLVAKEKPLQIVTYPNPSATAFGLSVQGGSSEKVQITVSDAVGRKVFEASGTSNKTYRFGDHFMPGMYFIKVIQGNTIQTQKIIKG